MKIIFLIDWSYSVGKDGIVLCCSITARYIIISSKYQNDNSIMLYKQLSIFLVSFYTTNCDLHFFAKLYIYPFDLADPDRLKLKLYRFKNHVKWRTRAALKRLQKTLVPAYIICQETFEGVSAA